MKNWSINPKKQCLNGNCDLYEINKDSDGEVVAYYVHELEDAQLIAEAPNLLSTLEQLMDCYNRDKHLLNFDVSLARLAVERATYIEDKMRGI